MFKTDLIKQLRVQHHHSQEEIAKKLHISRPTYDSIEKGENDLTLKQLQILAEIYCLSLTQLINNTIQEPEIRIESEGKDVKSASAPIRINVPQHNVKKFKEVLLYVLGKVGAKPNVGETVLYKLLYFIDFDYYEKYEKQLMGVRYIKNHHGPTPVEFKTIVEQMEEKGELEKVNSKYYTFNQKKYLPRRAPDLNLLSALEIKHIDEVLERLGDLNANELSALSHQDVPWITTKDGKLIEYEAVFYRTSATSVRKYEDD